MKEYIIPIIVALISSGTVGTIVTAVAKALLDKHMREDPQRVAMRLLLQDKLTDLCRKALSDGAGKISYSNYHLISQMYASYKTLGGNGDMEHLMDMVNRIPVFVDNPNK